MLHAVGEALALLGLGHPDNLHTQERYHGNSDGQRDHKVNGDSPWEVAYGIKEGAAEGQQEREEYGADAHCGQRHGHEILLHRVDGRVFRPLTLTHVFEITIDDHDAVVDNHTQYHNQAGQRNNVKRYVCKIHEGHADKCAQRYGNGCHDSRAKGEEHHHNENDDSHRQQQVA